VFGLNTAVAIYTPDGSGNYTVVARASLTCRMAVKPAPVATSSDRVELADRRLLMWDAEYAMPDTARILDADGSYWNVVPGTYTPLAGLNSTAIYRRCEVEKVLA